MRYLKFYEAFSSTSISSTLKFLRKEFGAESQLEFLTDIKQLLDVDVPLDTLDDSDLDYLSAKSAKLLKSKSTVQNEKGCDLIKFWFSVESGYLGYSGSGNKIIEDDNTYAYTRRAQFFSDSTMSWIRDNIIQKGELFPVTDYSLLQTGDFVLGCFDDSLENSRISLGTFFDGGADGCFVIQSVADGSSCADRDWRNYTQYGDKTWWVADKGRHGDDHNHLSFWRYTTKDLHYVDKLWKTEDDRERDLTWNIPFTDPQLAFDKDPYKFSKWSSSYLTITKADYRRADFALVLKYDDLQKKSYKNISDIVKVRKEEKEGATKLMSDDEIKKANIERYISKLSFELNITTNGLFNLEKFAKRNLLGEFSFISIWTKRPDWPNNLDIISSYLYKMLDVTSLSEKKDYLNFIKDLYKTQSKDYFSRLTSFLESKSKLKPGNMKNIFDNIFKLSNEINQKLIKKDINSIDELYLIRGKIVSIYSFLSMDRNLFSYGVRQIMSQFGSQEMQSYYIAYSKDYGEQEYEDDLGKIKRISEFIKRL